MADFDSNTLPSRRFIRFIAYKQLVADLTGEVVPLEVQRSGRSLYHQDLLPGNPVPFSQPGAGPAVTHLNAMLAREMVMPDPSDRPAAVPTTTVTEAVTPWTPSQIDQALFASTVDTLFNPQNRPDLFHPWETPTAAMAAELAVAAEIVLTYRQIQRNQANPVVQSLNQLL